VGGGDYQGDGGVKDTDKERKTILGALAICFHLLMLLRSWTKNCELPLERVINDKITGSTGGWFG
jgi:hypothetical protein